MILAELEVYHSRPVAPTRRVAIGHAVLPVDESPGFGGLLLGGIVARYSQALDPELLEELEILTYQVEQGQRIPQPRLRHRLQEDRVGLSRSVHRLQRLPNNRLHLEFEPEHNAPAQNVLAAVYVAGRFSSHGDVRTFAGDPAAVVGLGALGTQTWLISDGSGPHLYVLSLFLLALAGMALAYRRQLETAGTRKKSRVAVRAVLFLLATALLSCSLALFRPWLGVLVWVVFPFASARVRDESPPGDGS